jgi:hypothetical protein
MLAREVETEPGWLAAFEVPRSELDAAQHDLFKLDAGRLDQLASLQLSLQIGDARHQLTIC